MSFIRGLYGYVERIRQDVEFANFNYFWPEMIELDAETLKTSLSAAEVAEYFYKWAKNH